MHRSARWIGHGLVILSLAFAGCGGGDNGTQPGTLSITLSPTAATVQQGGSTTVIATATSGGGFSGTVSFAVSGAPAGVTGTVSGVTAAGVTTTATVTINVAVSTAPGTYTITVRSQGAGVADATVSFALTVTAAPDYALALTPAALTINQGANAVASVAINRTNFTEAVTLSLGGAPAGVTGAFAPAAPTGTSSTLTVTVGAAVAPGTYNLTVNGTGTPGNRSAALALTVAPAPAYSLALAPTALSITQGGNGNSSVTIARTNFAGAVTLSLGNAPAGVTGSFAPAAPTGTSSTLTVSVGASVAPGTYNLTVDGTGTAGNRSAPLTLTVLAPAPDYALSLSPAALTIGQGNNANSTVTITRTNFTGAVTLSLGSAPAGVTGTFAPPAPTGTTSTLTVSVGASVAAGTYNLTVDGTGPPGSRSTPLTLTVSNTPDYTLSLTPTSLTIVQGTTDSTDVAITRTNFAGAVTLSLGGAPAGVTGAFVPAAPTGTTSKLTVTVGGAVAPGTYNLTVDGAGTPGNRFTPLTLTVTATPNYALSILPTALTIGQGANDNAAVTITRTNFAGAVTLSLGNAPAGVTGVFAPAAPTGTSSTLTVSVGGAVTPGTYNLTVDGTGTPGARSTPLALTVTATPNYSLAVSPNSLSIAQSANANTAVTITRTNFAGAVTLSLGGAPAGVTGTFAPPAPTGTSSTLTVSVGPSVTPGTYNLTVDGTGTPGSRSTPLSLTVTGGGGGNVTLNFAACAVADRPVWLAYQDGAGAWTRVVGVSDVYTFNVASGTGGVAYVVLGAGNMSNVNVFYRTQAELTGTISLCGPAVPLGRTITGTAAGVGPTEMAMLGLGGGAVQVLGAGSLAFQIVDVSDGTHDLVGFRQDLTTPGAERVLLRRDIVVSGNASIGTVDFAGSESAAAASATITLGGLAGGETVLQTMAYHVGATCQAATLVPFAAGGTTFGTFGVPSGLRRVSDYHRLSITAAGTNESRLVSESFNALAARTINLGTSLPIPTISTLAGPYKRLQAVFALPLEYTGGSSFGYVDASTDKVVNMSASFGYFGGGSITLALADFSGLGGWDNNWAPASASTGSWNIFGNSSSPGSFCSEGQRTTNATRSGSF